MKSDYNIDCEKDAHYFALHASYAMSNVFAIIKEVHLNVKDRFAGQCNFLSVDALEDDAKPDDTGLDKACFLASDEALSRRRL